MRTFTTFVLVCLTVSQMLASNDFTTPVISKAYENSLPQISERMTRQYYSQNHSLLHKAPLRVADGSEVISEAPDGTAVSYNTTGTAYMAFWGMVGTIPVEDFVTELVYCEDGSVYWKNSVTMIVANTYIKGQDKGDRIVFDLPQVLLLNPEHLDEEGNPTYAYAQRMKYDEESQFYYVMEENNTVSLIKNDDGSLTADIDGTEIIGMTTPEGMWYGYGNYNTVLSPAEAEVVVTPPEGLQTEEWMLISDYIGSKVELGFDGNDVYFRNLVKPMFDDPGLVPDDYWVKGTLNGDAITLPTQYIGKSDLLMVSVYFSPAMMYDEESIEKFESATLTYDAEAKIMTSDLGMSLTGGAGFVFGYTETPTIRWQPADIALNLPKPVIVDAFNFDVEIGYGVFAFNLPALNKDGYALDPEYIFTRLYVNGEPYIFSPEDYDIEEEMEWIPFLFEDGWDFHQWGQYHRFDLYFDGADSMGIEAKYDDGTSIYLTDIVSINLIDAVDTITDGAFNGKEILSANDTEIFNINGTKCNANSLKPGIYIVLTSGKAKKIVVK